jgi:hypothetical protein
VGFFDESERNQTQRNGEPFKLQASSQKLSKIPEVTATEKQTLPETPNATAPKLSVEKTKQLLSSFRELETFAKNKRAVTSQFTADAPRFDNAVREVFSNAG